MKTFFTIAGILASVGLGSLPANAGMISFADYATSNDGGIENNSVITFNTGDSFHFRHTDTMPTPGRHQARFHFYGQVSQALDFFQQ